MERPFLTRMKSALSDILTSKKVLMAIAAGVAAFAGKYGLELSTETVILVVSPLVAAILGQSVSDIGKEAEKVAARLGKPSEMTQTVTVEASPAPEQEASNVSRD